MARVLIGKHYIDDEDTMLIVSQCGYVLTNAKEWTLEDTLIFDIEGPGVPQDCEFVELVVDTVKRLCWCQRMI